MGIVRKEGRQRIEYEKRDIGRCRRRIEIDGHSWRKGKESLKSRNRRSKLGIQTVKLQERLVKEREKKRKRTKKKQKQKKKMERMSWLPISWQPLLRFLVSI